MNHAFPELIKALSIMLDKIDETIKKSGYKGEPVKMYLAGGLAINHYCGTRYTEDVDASFSRRILLPYSDLVVDYRRSDGSTSFIYFDQNYNPTFALLHEDYEKDSLEWEGIGNEKRIIHLYVLSPLDLAISKIARFSEQDREDIMNLAKHKFFTAVELKNRSEEALTYYIGNTSSVRGSIHFICDRINQEQNYD